MDGSQWWIVIKLYQNDRAWFAFSGGATSEEHLATHYFDRDDAEEEARRLFQTLGADKAEVVVKRETVVMAMARRK